MGGDEDGDARLCFLLDQVPESQAVLDVDAGGRLVEEEDARPMQGAQREAGTLAHSRGELARVLVLRLGESEALAERAPALLERRARQAVESGVELEVLSQRQPRIQAHALSHVADEIAHAPRRSDDVDPRHLDGARCRREESDQHADRRALARAVRAEEREDRSGRDREAEVVDRGEVAEALREVRGADDRVSPALAVLAMGVAPRRHLRAFPIWVASAVLGLRAGPGIELEAVTCRGVPLIRRGRRGGIVAGRALAGEGEERRLDVDGQLLDEANGGERGHVAEDVRRARRAPDGHLDPRVATGGMSGGDVGQGARVARERARVVGPGAVQLDPGGGAQLGRRAARDDAAAVEIHEAIAAGGFVEVARAEEDQGVDATRLQHRPDLAARDDVDPGGGLVENEQGGLREECVRDGELLLHAARERASRTIGVRCQAGAIQQLTGATLEVGFGEPVQTGSEAQVFHDRQVAVQAECLWHVAELRLHCAHVAGEIDAEDARLLGGELEEAGERSEQGRLAGTVRADDADDLRPGERQVDPRERHSAAETLLEPAEQHGLIGPRCARRRARPRCARVVRARCTRVRTRFDPVAHRHSSCVVCFAASLTGPPRPPRRLPPRRRTPVGPRRCRAPWTGAAGSNRHA